MSEYQNIVIIGASCSGHALANSLVPILPTTHRIVLIDSFDYAYWPIAALRAAVVPGWENKVVRPLTQETVFPAESIHKMVNNTRVVELKANSVVLDKPFEGSKEVPFFKAIIATGSAQATPMRAQNGSTKEDTVAALVKMQGEIKAAKKIVIIGAGPVGVEVAGEIRDAYPDKSITIVHNGPRVLEGVRPAKDVKTDAQSYTMPTVNPKLSTALDGALKSFNIEVILNDRAEAAPDTSGAWEGAFGAQGGVKQVKLASGKSIEADYVFLSVGNKSNSTLIETADAAATDHGLVKVDEYLKVQSSSLSNYFAIGDVSNTPGWKTFQGAKADAEGLAPIIVAEVKGRKPKSYKRSAMHGMMIPLGPNAGRGYATFPYLGDVFFPEFMVKVAKAKTLFVPDLFIGAFKGAEKVEAA